MPCGTKRRAIGSKLDLPYDCVCAPDRGIQNIIEASIRGIEQNRDYRNGVPDLSRGTDLLPYELLRRRIILLRTRAYSSTIRKMQAIRWTIFSLSSEPTAGSGISAISGRRAD